MGKSKLSLSLPPKRLVSKVKEYDGLFNGWHDEIEARDIEEWFIHKATAPELIRRARQFLTERNYLIVKESVAQHAQEAGEKFSKAIRH